MKRLGAVQADTPFPDADRTSVVEGVTENMQVSVYESFTIFKFLDIRPDRASDRIRPTPVPGNMGQGDEKMLDDHARNLLRFATGAEENLSLIESE